MGDLGMFTTDDLFDIDDLFDNIENDDFYGIAFESECCPYTRESSIYESIAEYERMNERD